MNNYNFFSKQMNDGDGVSLSTPLTATIQAHRACMPYSIRIGGKRQESRVERQETRDKRQESRVGRCLLRRVAAVVLCLLTVGVGQTWGAGQYNYNWYGNVFFRVPDNWDLTNYNTIQVAVSRTTDATSSNHIEYLATMQRVETTRLFYVWISADHRSWSQTEYLLFTANNSTKTSGNAQINSNQYYTTPIDYGCSNSDNPYLFNPSSESNGASVSGSYSSSGTQYSDRRANLLNKAQTVDIYTNGAQSYTGGSVQITGTYLADNTSTSSSSVSNSTNNYVSYNNTIGTPVTLTATANDGYAFLGWFEASSGGTAISTNTSYTYTCKEQKKLYARFAKTSTVTFDKASGTGGSSSVTATYGVDMPSATMPTRNGYVFNGYYDGENGTGTSYYTADGASATTWDKTSNTTLHAYWVPVWQFYNNTTHIADFTRVNDYQYECTVTLSSSNAEQMHFLKDGTTYYYPDGNNPTTTDNTLTSDAGTGMQNYTTMGLTNTEYTLTIKSDNSGSSWYLRATASSSYSVTYYGNNNTSGNAPTDDSSPYEPGADVTVKTKGNLARTGYTFTSWNTAANGSGTSYTESSTINSISASYNLYAQWSENMTTVTVNVNPSGAGTLTVDAAAFTAGNTTTAGVTTSHTVVATANTGKAFQNWTVTGNATGSASTNTYTLNGNGSAGTGTLIANFGVASGWYIYGDSWETWNKAEATEQLTYPYRDISGVYYIPTTIAANKYFRLTDKSSELNFSDNTSSDFALTKGEPYTLASNSTKATYSTSDLGDVWVVMNTNGTKKAWVQDPATYYTITLANGSSSDNLSGTEGTVTLTTNNLENLQTKQYASGERVNIQIDTIAGYRISSVSLGGTAVTMAHSSGTAFTGNTTMPASNATLTITYRHVCKVTYNANNPTSGSAPAAQTDITVGSDVTLRANTGSLAKTDYIFMGWNTAADGRGTHYDAGGTLSSISGDQTLYAEWKHIPTLSAVTASPTGTQNYAGSPITFNLSVTSQYVSNPVVIFYIAKTGGDTYEVVGAPYGAEGNSTVGTIGTATNDSTTVHKATFTFSDAGTYTVTAKLFRGKLVESFEVADYTTWESVDEGSFVRESNTNKDATNGSDYRLKITPNSTDWKSALTRSTTKWNNDYRYIHTKMYYTAGTTLKFKINDDPTELESSHGTDNQWNKTVFDNSSSKTINFMFPFITGNTAAFYIDDIILSNVSALTDANKSAASTGTAPTFTINYNYTVTLNNAGATTAGTESVNVTYGTSTGLTNITCPTKTGYTFGGYYTEEAGAGTLQINASGVWQNAAYVSSGNWASGSDQTLYAKWTGHGHTVSFNYGTGSGATTSKAVTFGSAYGTLPEVTAPSGCVFSGWFTAPTGGTLVGADTLVTTDNDHTLYARITQRDRVYFYNNLGWSDVYVTYDAYWVNGTYGAANKDKTYQHMTQIAGTDIWYADIPDAILSSWKYFVAFNEKNAGSAGLGTYDRFDDDKVVFRHDFDSYATLFVPERAKTDKWDKNAHDGKKAEYFSSSWTYDAAEGSHGENYRQNVGYWMRYNDIRSGYTITGDWDSWANTTALMAATPGETTFTMTKTLAANTTYEFLLYKEYTTNTYNHVFTDGNAGTMTSSSCTDWAFYSNKAKYSELTSNHTKITTTVAGEYTFQLKTGTDGRLLVSVIYPFAQNDYRVLYSWNDGSAHTHASEILKAEAGTKDTISVFVHEASNVTSQSLTIQKCTEIDGSGNPTWKDVTGSTITLPSEEITENGVYDFIITYLESGEPTGAYWNKYDGNIYIRTESADGGWSYYKEHSDNIMTYSAYSMTQTLSEPYSHYYCRYIENTGMDITYQIATDYSPCVSDILVGDATIGGSSNKTLPSGNPANIRFTWNEETNALRRAYLKSAQGSGNTRFLVLHGNNNIFKASNGEAIGEDVSQSLHADELLFSDLGNWIYQVELQAFPSAEVKLIARYNGDTEAADRYLIGDNDHSQKIMSGTAGSTKYAITAVYDFKTNRLMTVWTPSGEITDNLADVDMLLIRHAQDAATRVNLGSDISITTKRVYGAIELRYDSLFGHVTSWTSSSRRLLKYMISFPFTVNISDIFGLNGRYGEAYIIQKYDGEDRAARGFFRGDGTTTFWKTLAQNDSLQANVGYSVIFDNDYLNGDAGSIWENKSAGSKVYLYFPSARSNVGTISSTSKTITIPEWKCEIDRTFISASAGREVNHKNTDSNWNMMGVPIFDTHNDDGSTAGQPGAVFADTDTYSDESRFNYFFEWNPADNQFAVHTAKNYSFKSMHGYMVQYHGNVTFMAAAAPAASVAARRMSDKEYQVELQVLDGEEEILNRTYVELRNNACDTFALNEDVYMSYNSQAVNIYTLAGNYDVAANILSIDDHIVPVGVEVARAGRYTFSMPSEFSGTVTLVDNFDGSRTDLSLGDYSVTLPKGTIEDRFTLEINIARSTTTDIEGIEGGSIKDGKAHKFVRDGIMYILRDGVIYDARGARMKSER